MYSGEFDTSLIGKTIRVYREWYMGQVFYIDIYLDKSDKLFAKRQVFYNHYSKKIEKECENQVVFAPMGWEICKFDDNFYQI